MNNCNRDRIYIPYYSLYNDRIVIHQVPEDKKCGHNMNKKSLDNLKKEKFTGNISHQKKCEIRKRLTAWLRAMLDHYNSKNNLYSREKRLPVFVTLTLSAKCTVDDNKIKRELLGQFIREMQTKFDVKYYFWKAESQQNENIHFHLLLDNYIPRKQLQTIWNRIQNKYNLVDIFEQKYNHRNPPSTHVTSVTQVNNFVDYVLKYCLKNDNHRKIDGRVYGMSDELRKLNVYKAEIHTALANDILKAEENKDVLMYRDEFFTVIIFLEGFYHYPSYRYLKDQSRLHYLKLYDSIY